jgi:alpha-L-glutamate ligase-like protein
MPWKQIFGMNRRNRELVYRFNSPSAILLANDKIACKKALMAGGVPVPMPIVDVHRTGEMRSVPTLLQRADCGFVVKPSNGCQGMGVELFTGATARNVVRKQGSAWSHEDFVYYLCRILSGEYSKGRPKDSAIIEQLVDTDADWIMPDLPGAPDLRVIVVQGRPVMAMTRIPTLRSNGKANLHRGGVGVGINLETGRTTHGVWRERAVIRHPDTGGVLAGRPVEDFFTCLEMAARCADAVPLGFMGVDIMRDRESGPCVIEVNARPGLAIQLANLLGLDSAIRNAVSEKSPFDKGIVPHQLCATDHV